MAAEWQDVSLGDLVEIEHGFAFKGSFFHDEPPGDVLLTPGNFATGGGFRSDKIKYYRGPVPGAFVLSEGDLLITMTDLSKTTDTLGYPALVPRPEPGRRFLHNQRLGRVTIKRDVRVEKGFLYYLLCCRDYRNEVLASATGTTVKHTSPSRIERFRFGLPPRDDQRAIAHILGTLDDRIKLNRRMNGTLEAMVQALFKSWFVDFDPVRAKSQGRDLGLPKSLADVFPDRFEDSEFGDIPAGWDVGSLGDVAMHPRRGVQPDGIDASTPYIALEHMPKRSIALVEWSFARGLESNKFEFKRGEILFGKLRPYFHKVGVAPVDGVCSTDVVVIAPMAEKWFGLVLGHVSSTAFVEHTNAGSTGTKMPRTSWTEMARYPVVIPPERIAGAFTSVVRPAVDHVIASIHESRTLATLRDTLLPKLISGELRAKEAGKRLAEPGS